MTKQRGFSLVEVAIVVVVIGILASAFLVPLGSVLVEEQYDREQVSIERARMAVIGYAARSATPGAIIHLDGNTGGANRFVVPAGRAYFPCPDISGDGIEDRNLYDENLALRVMTGTSVGGLTVAFLAGGEGVIVLHRFKDSPATADVGDLATVGSCSVMRGFLPWKTLGLPPTDTWGNLYTYAVDSLYSHSIVGFNQNSIIEEVSPHELTDADGNFRMSESIIGMVGSNESTNYNKPIQLCLGASGLCNGTGTAATIVALGDPATLTADTARRASGAETFRDGLVFIIVSHGKNGLGAGKHNPGGNIRCNQSSTASGNHEGFNYPLVGPGIAGLTGNCASQNTARDPEYFTILRRNDIGADLTFDDVMVWATRDQINEAITRNSPDLPVYLPRCANMAQDPPTPC